MTKKEFDDIIKLYKVKEMQDERIEHLTYSTVMIETTYNNGTKSTGIKNFRKYFTVRFNRKM